MNKKDGWLRILAGVLIVFSIALFGLVYLHQKGELDKQRIDISFMKNRLAYHDTAVEILDKDLQTQKDNIETIMKWNEIQAKRIQQLERKLGWTKQIAKGSLELSQKNKNAIGWSYLNK